MAISPKLIFTFPFDGIGFSTNIQEQVFYGEVSEDTEQVYVNGSIEDVEFNKEEGTFTYRTLLEPDENLFNFVAVDDLGVQSIPTKLVVIYTTPDQLSLVLKPPTAIKAERYRNKIKVTITENKEPEVIGYNFYFSVEPAGGLDGYLKMNKTLVQIPEKFIEDVTLLDKEVTLDENNNRVTKTVEKVSQIYKYSYMFDIVDFPNETVLPTAERYFVVTANGYDEVTKELVESPYSAEVTSSILKFDTSIKDLNPRVMSDILVTAITRIRSVNDQIDLQVGSEVRDTSLDPMSLELERIYVLLDFMHRSQSFLTLLQLDDTDNDGVSDLVKNSKYKTTLKDALFVEDDQEVQDLIDDAFTKLAGNTNTFRKEATNAIVTLTFYTTIIPKGDLNVYAGCVVMSDSDPELGYPAQKFVTLSSMIMKKDKISSYYDPLKGWYSVKVTAKASLPGKEGNIGANKIKTIVSGADNNFKVINEEAANFGTDAESNNSLARRAQLAFISVDTGTPGGYLSKALAINNVLNGKIVSAGHPLMLRDWDEVRHKHIFGKVDSYIHGEVLLQVQEVFPFSYNKVGGSYDKPAEQFEIINPFVLRSNNSDLSSEHPIYKVESIFNSNKNEFYNLDNLIIEEDGKTIIIDGSIPHNLNIGMDNQDVIKVVYSYRSKFYYKPLRQPVVSIYSLTGDTSGDLSNNYTLYQNEDPLWLGRSNKASDFIEIEYKDGKPLGEMILVENEELVLVSTANYGLENKGVDVSSIVVKSADLLTTFALNIDYKVIEEGNKVYISHIARGIIKDGELVKVTYTYGENLTLTYTINSVLEDVAKVYEKDRHLTADVVTKAVVLTAFDITASIVLHKNADQSKVDSRIKTLISRFLEQKGIGESVYQSDIIHIIELVDGVSHVVLPLIEMVRSDSNMVVREELKEVIWTDLGGYYKSQPILKYKTIEGGGSKYKHTGIYEGMEVTLKKVDSELEVKNNEGSGFISGDGIIYVNPYNKHIEQNKYFVTYYIYGETGQNDIEITDIEKVVAGNMSFIYSFRK